MFKRVVRFLAIVLVLTIAMGVASPLQVQADTNSSDDSKSIKVLMLGNSHSHYTSKYLYDIFKACGYDDVTVGFCMRGGRSLKFIYDSLINDKANVTYAKNNKGRWRRAEGKKKATVKEALKDEDWDYIFLQNSILGQVKKRSYYVKKANGKRDMSDKTFIPMLLIKKIKKYCPDAKFGWSMIHASEDSAVKRGKYNGKPDKLYKDIVRQSKKIVYSKNLFDTYAWTGPVMERMLHSYLKPNCLDDEDRHAAPGFARYAMGMCVAKACGADVSLIKGAEIEAEEYSQYNFDTINRFIDETYANPWKIRFVKKAKRKFFKKPNVTRIEAGEEVVTIKWKDVGAVNYLVKYQAANGRWRTVDTVRDASYTFKKEDLGVAKRYKVVAEGDGMIGKKSSNPIYLYFKTNKQDSIDKTEQAD